MIWQVSAQSNLLINQYLYTIYISSKLSSIVKNQTPLFQDLEFLRRPWPFPLGKKGPNSVNAPPPIEEQPGPEHMKLHISNRYLNNFISINLYFELFSRTDVGHIDSSISLAVERYIWLLKRSKHNVRTLGCDPSTTIAATSAFFFNQTTWYESKFSSWLPHVLFLSKYFIDF